MPIDKGNQYIIEQFVSVEISLFEEDTALFLASINQFLEMIQTRA